MTIQLYRNPVYYPDYKYTITPVGSVMAAKPVTLQTRSGTISASIPFDTLFSVNYLRIVHGNSTLWAWIRDVRSMGREHAWEIDYEIDPLRTYMDHITWGRQFVLRDMTATYHPDPLLGTPQHHLNHRSVKLVLNGTNNEHKRVFVVQCRPGESGIKPSVIPTLPNGYVYFLREYDIRTPESAGGITNFVKQITNSAPDPRLVTAYSVPWFDTTKFDQIHTLTDYTSWSAMFASFGEWRYIGSTAGKTLVPADLVQTLVVQPQTLPTYFKRVPHQARVIVPGAGLLSVSDYMLEYGFTIRRDMDFFTGACNYMLMRMGGDGAGPDGQSVRSSAIASIPIVGDPKDVYITQNQNALSTALLGDVAMIGGGILATYFGMPGGLMQVAHGVSGIGERNTRLKDLENQPTSPPAMLAPALVNSFNDTVYLDISYKDCTNETMVHEETGYPQHLLKTVTLPSNGFLQTQNCSVTTTGQPPQWAIEAINTQADMGIRFFP